MANTRALRWVTRSGVAASVSPSWSVASLKPAGGAVEGLTRDQLERLATLASLRPEAAVENQQALSEMMVFCQQVASAPSSSKVSSDVPAGAMDVADLEGCPPAPPASFDALAAAPKRDGQYIQVPKHDVLG